MAEPELDSVLVRHGETTACEECVSLEDGRELESLVHGVD